MYVKSMEHTYLGHGVLWHMVMGGLGARQGREHLWQPCMHGNVELGAPLQARYVHGHCHNDCNAWPDLPFKEGVHGDSIVLLGGHGCGGTAGSSFHVALHVACIACYGL